MTAATPALPDGLGRLHGARRLGGGSICTVWAGTLDDATPVVVKRAPYPVDVEVDGLTALAHAGAPVPDVLAADDDVLVLRHVSGDADWHALGVCLADVHRTTCGDRFGWHRDNLLGRAIQLGGWSDDWPVFLVEQRLRPLLGADALPDDVRRRLERAIAGPLGDLLGAHAPSASLVHGDLWSGNIVDGSWLVDPAVWMADRELELAFTRLFGGVPEPFFAGYDSRWPLPSGAAQRRPALQLYHLLIHVWHFGAGYVGPVVDRLDSLGWH
ncbi:MAG TPA: fructosamine kinase family protein [Euzebyales bacterium]|nr:fructosamine kinase family protein [Euzebyales bacterium]